jgi:DNA-directed RNA polymerase subunit RPC12/RpoP
MAIIWPTLQRIKSPLKITCRQCGNRQTWSKERAIVNLGGHTQPHTIRHKLRCSRCGARGRDGWIDTDASM